MWKRFGGRGYQNATFYPSRRVPLPLMRVTGTTNHDHRIIDSLAYVHITMHYNDMPSNNTPLCT